MKHAPPYFMVEWQDADAAAIQALASGTATEAQQKRALDWIINRGAMAYDVTFQAEGDRVSAFAEGRRFVGLQIVKLLKINLSVLRRTK